MSTILSLRHLELWTRIGVTEEERTTEQRLLVSLELTLEEQAGTTDRLEDTADYATLVARIRALAKGERRTIERLAAEVAETVLMTPSIEQVTVTLEKRPLPGMHSASITLTRP